MKKIAKIIGFLFLSGSAFASFIFNPGTGGGPKTLTDANGCKWLVGNTVDISGCVSSTLISCPASGSLLMETGAFLLEEDGGQILVE